MANLHHLLQLLEDGATVGDDVEDAHQLRQLDQFVEAPDFHEAH